MTRRAAILPSHTPELFAAAVAQAVALLRAGEVVALPTETVYGLAANALDPAAVHRIFEVKGRPADNPVIVHVAGMDLARRCAATWPRVADRLARAFWPGPLTLVVERASELPDAVTAGGSTVGLRWPSHPFIQAVIRQAGFPLAAPSANRSTELSPTNAEHVNRSLGDAIPLIVDGGQAQVGIESTVLDVTTLPPRVLRPGMISEEAIRAVLGTANEVAAPSAGQSAPGIRRSPGLMARHYAPRTRLTVLAWTSTDELEQQLAARGWHPRRCGIVAHTVIPGGESFGDVSVIPHDPEAFARALYAELHRCDALNLEGIVVEAVPADPAWRAVADRLRRASTPT